VAEVGELIAVDRRLTLRMVAGGLYVDKDTLRVNLPKIWVSTSFVQSLCHVPGIITVSVAEISHLPYAFILAAVEISLFQH
jgi:hypothetical protein